MIDIKIGDMVLEFDREDNITDIGICIGEEQGRGGGW